MANPRVWFDISDPTKVISINRMTGLDTEGYVISDAIRKMDNELYEFVFPTDQPELKQQLTIVDENGTYVIDSGNDIVDINGDPTILFPDGSTITDGTSANGPVTYTWGNVPVDGNGDPAGAESQYVIVPSDAYVQMKDQSGLDAVALQRAKNRQNALIKQGFEDADNDGLTVTLTVGDVKVDCARENQNDFMQAYEKAQRDSATEVIIRDYDNNYHTVVPADCQTVYYAIQDYGIAMYNKKWTKQGLIDVQTTVEGVEAITWDSIDS